MRLNQNELRQLSKSDLKKVLWYVKYKHLLGQIAKLRISQLAMPTLFAQIFVFVTILPQSLVHYATANLIIVAVVHLPWALRNSKIKYHWVKSNDTTIHRQ